MTPPLYDLNLPPSPDNLNRHHHLQFFLSLPQHTATASSSTSSHPTFFNNKPQQPKPYHLKVNDYMSHDGGSSDQQASSSSSSVLQSAALVDLSLSRKEDNGDHYESASDHDGNGSSVKWMSSKMRIMKKIINSNCSINESENNNYFQSPFLDSTDETNSFRKSNGAIRVCSDCNTTTTPLWRSGPRGPKSLCNACGIRQRKARRLRALEVAAANGVAVVKDASTCLKIKVHEKKETKKTGAVHVGQCKKQLKISSNSGNNCVHHQRKKRLCLKEFAVSLSKKKSGLQGVFPEDVENAAILLMELSCGLIHT